MPAAVWRTRPARSISLWLTIWASAGLSLRTGRKAWDQRMARGCRVAATDTQPDTARAPHVAGSSQTTKKNNPKQKHKKTTKKHKKTHPQPNKQTLGLG